MHTTTVRSALSLGTSNDRTPWRSRLRSILSSRWRGNSEEWKQDSLCPLDDRLLSDVGLCQGNRTLDPQHRIDQQQRSPVPAALLAVWMPRI
jgi:hypothetical protein